MPEDGGAREGNGTGRRRGPQALLLQQQWLDILRLPDPDEKVDALISLPQARALVQSLPGQDLYLLVKQQGLVDATELVALSSPEQFRTFVDLDCWRHGLFDPRLAYPWIKALALGGSTEMAQQIEGLDEEQLGLILRSLVRIHLLEPEAEIPEGESFFYLAPDRSFILEALDTEELGLARLLIELKETVLGPLGLSRYVSMLYHELLTQLEHDATRWRDARLEDLGFVPFDEALSLYFPLPPEALRATEGPAALEAESDLPRWLTHREMGPLLDQTLVELPEALRTRVEQDLIYLLNALMSASSVDPGDEEAVATVLGRARGYLEIAFDLLGASDPARAAALLDRMPVRYLFRWTATGLHGLRQRARSLGRASGRLPLQEQAWVEALSQLPPRLADGSEFNNRQQLVLAETQLSLAEDMLTALRVDSELAAVQRDLPAVTAFVIVLARRVLGEPGSEPLTEQQARRFLRQNLSEGRLGGDVREEVAGWLQQVLGDERRGRLLADAWCDALEEELGGLDPEVPLEPQHLSGWLQGGRA